MSKVLTKTDNSFLFDKVQLRLNHLPKEDNINVLDCYAGDGVIWSNVKRQSKKNISVVSIEEKKREGVYLKGNNLKFLKTINLNSFNVIDLDAYGVPYEQLRIIFSKHPKNVVVFVTFIQSLYGGLPKRMLCDIGYSRTMVDKIPSLFFKDGFSKFLRFLYLNNVRNVYVRNFERKHYLCFKIS